MLISILCAASTLKIGTPAIASSFNVAYCLTKSLLPTSCLQYSERVFPNFSSSDDALSGIRTAPPPILHVLSGAGGSSSGAEDDGGAVN